MSSSEQNISELVVFIRAKILWALIASGHLAIGVRILDAFCFIFYQYSPVHSFWVCV